MAQKRVLLSSQYDAEAARKLLRAHGWLIETGGGILPSRLGISKDEFLTTWNELDFIDFDSVYDRRISELNAECVSKSQTKKIDPVARMKVFLMRALTELLLLTVAHEPSITLVGLENGRVDAVFVRSTTRKIDVSKFILDIFEDDPTLIEGETVRNMAHFLKKLSRRI